MLYRHTVIKMNECLVTTDKCYKNKLTFKCCYNICSCFSMKVKYMCCAHITDFGIIVYQRILAFYTQNISL